jgi:fructose 5-dehydrogenase small subunit
MGACAAAAALAFTSVARFNPRLDSLDLSGIAPAFADAPAGGGLDAFLALSQHLTARVSFNPVLAKRVYAALVQSDNQFTQNVAALNTWLVGHSAAGDLLLDQRLREKENLSSIVIYLRSVPPVSGSETHPRDQWGNPANDV